MTEREKVINALENCVHNGVCINCEHNKHTACKTCLMIDALELLKEKEAVKPTWSRGKPFCGACGMRIHGGKFCSECGKPILWESRLYCINCGQELN